jgi:hypothetical protein
MGLGAKTTVRLLEESHRHRRTPMRSPSHERECAPQIAAH